MRDVITHHSSAFKSTAMASYNLLNIDYDIISLIFSHLITDSFSSFANLFWVWHFNQSINTIRYVLRKMDWDEMYVMINYPEEIPKGRFESFLKVCLELDIEQAHFLYSTKMLLRSEAVHHHLNVLKINSTLHPPSHFAYLVFKAMYCPFQWDSTVKEMAAIIIHPYFRKRVPEFIYLIRDIKGDDNYDIFPIYKLCPNAKNKQSFLHTGWFPYERHVWSSLCSKVVPQSQHVVSPFDQCITIDHISQTQCAYCSMQSILYKVVYGIYL